jgi:hypothetical protein
MKNAKTTAAAIALLSAIALELVFDESTPASYQYGPNDCQSSSSGRQILAFEPDVTTTCRIGDTRGPKPPLGTPQDFIAGESTTLLVTLQVTLYPNLIPNSVMLLQVDSQGNRIAVLGKMNYDAAHSNVKAGDGYFVAQPRLNPAVAAREFFLAAEASYSGSSACSQLDNNDHEVNVSRPPTTMAQMHAEDAVERAVDHYYDSRVPRVGLAQAKLDLVNFLLSNYGPKGTLQRGLVVKAVLSPSGQSVWWTYNDGIKVGLGDAVPGVAGSGSRMKSKSAVTQDRE